MPLPFLTADRDGAATDVATGTAVSPPREAPEDMYESRHLRWRRPYHPGPLRVGGTAVVLLLAACVLFSGVIIALAGSLPGAGICVAVAALLITIAFRLVRTGIWVGPKGLRQLSLLSGTTLSWADVAGVRTVQQPVRLLGLPRTVQGQVLVVERTQGKALPALVSDQGADFLGRPRAFAETALAVEDEVAEFKG
ncbi:hypothetical protein [Streptomyces cinnamoneus]|uniref:Membrane protein n=1 Tax=Streptomyces cinnamoneus TaxID=53446 RepID=A0A918WRC3_STRCJ|nr:hypothetical protein [Streptomyces cinnamoneus]GHC71743.1 membrane protein [Streptomyces cinnamoneus]